MCADVGIRKSKLYITFRGNVPKQTYFVKDKSWTYYDLGEKTAPCIVLLSTTTTRADVYFHQILTLASHGYRCVSAEWSSYWTHEEWVKGFHQFLTSLGLLRIHLFGSSISGFLALQYIAAYPKNIESLILCNSFVDTSLFSESATCVPFFKFMPEFLLKKYILDSFPQGPYQMPEIARAMYASIPYNVI